MVRASDILVASMSAMLLASALCAQVDWHSIPSLHARRGHGLAHDPVRDRIVMFGGKSTHVWAVTDETWEWTGTEWLPRDVPGPSPREGGAMAWDPIRQEVILFGGTYKDSAGLRAYLGDTWSWDGRRWRRLSPSTAPSPRCYAAVATDPVRGEVVLFGGVTGPGVLPLRSDETWTWDGSTWTQRAPQTVPFSSSMGVLVPVPNRPRLLLAGGISGSLSPIDGTYLWEWDGTDWTRLPTPAGPVPTHFECAAADPSTGAVLVLENDQSYHRTARMWSWDGSAWTETLPTSTHFSVWPAYSPGNRMILDPSHARLLTFGGSDGAPYQVEGGPSKRATWSFDLGSRQWSIVHDVPWCGGGSFGVAHDADRGRTLFVGNGETWVYEDGGFHELPITSPPHGGSAGFVECHYASGLVVLQGSHQFPYGTFDDRTWLFDGSQWTARLYSPRPLRSVVGTLSSTYDPIGRRILALDYRLDELWSFKPGSGWQVVSQTPPLAGCSIAFDSARRRLVVVEVRHDRVWEWDGSAWAQISHATSLPWTGLGWWFNHVPELGGVVLFRALEISTQPGETWLWDGVDWRPLPVRELETAGDEVHHVFYDPERGRLTASFGTRSDMPMFELFDETLKSDSLYPAPGTSSTFTFTDASQSGRAWLLALSLSTRDGVPLLPQPHGVLRRFPLDPDFMFVATVGNLRGTLDGGGRGSITMPIPNDQSLLGLKFHAAALTVGPSQIGAFSNTLSLEVMR